MIVLLSYVIPPNNLKFMIEEMKKKYKITPEDKIKRINNSITMMKEFLDILKK